MSTVVSLGSVALRPPQRIPEHSDGADTISYNTTHRIEFKHPAYSDDCNTFLILAAFDHPDGGLHYNTALVACGIIAGNRWNGHFTATKGGPKVLLHDDDLMPHGQVYFYLPGYTYERIEESYPITPNFSHWAFPHDNLPLNWRLPPGVSPPSGQTTRSNASLSATLRDGEQCRVSGRKEQCRVAHIVPVEEDEWFHANAMSRYVLDNQRRSRAAITDVNNLMLLRADLHTSFDTAKKFVFVPKKPERNRSNMVTHLLSSSAEYGPIYHNTLAYSLDPIPRPYLFARFAWAIFPPVEPFLLHQEPRLLTTCLKEQGQPHTYSPEECREFTIPRSNRSGTGSPKKRPRQPTASDESRLRKECTKRLKLISTDSSVPDIEPSPDPILEPILSPSEDHASSAFTHGTPEMEVWDTSVAPEPVTAGIGQLDTSLYDEASSDASSDWDRFCALRERMLKNERQKSDPGGNWLEEVNWAMDILKHEHSARDTQAWAYVDEAHRILGEVDDSRE